MLLKKKKKKPKKGAKTGPSGRLPPGTKRSVRDTKFLNIGILSSVTTEA